MIRRPPGSTRTDTLFPYTSLFRSCGWLMEVGLLEVEGEDLIGLVIETGCAYASPISFPQRVEIGLRVARIGNSSVTYHLGVFVEGAEAASAQGHFRSEERRVGKECVSRCRSRWSPYP